VNKHNEHNSDVGRNTASPKAKNLDSKNDPNLRKIAHQILSDNKYLDKTTFLKLMKSNIKSQV
jgi:hypothetical protein